MKSLVRSLPLLALAACAGAPPGSAPPPPAAAMAPAAQESGAFVVRLGRDTLAVEQYTRSPGRIEGTLVSRAPRTLSRAYAAELGPDGSVTRFTVTNRVLSDPALLPQEVTVAFAADSADVRIQRGDTVRTLRAPRGDALPWISNSYALLENALRHARADSVSLGLYSPGGRALTPHAFRRFGADSVLVTNTPGTSRLQVDARGRILSARSHPTSTFKVEADRVPAVDVAALGAAFAARDRAGQGLGTLSPRDSITVAVGTAAVTVAYGRPSRRGRTILGGVVPFGQVWRTGANEATRFATTRDLMFGGTHVPAGQYSLWTLPGPDGWQLIINRNTGQWGTDYRPDQDLVRIPARAVPSRGNVEQLTIRVAPLTQGAGGNLVVAWDDFEVVAPFTVM
ncbi:MAG TPA: DUF2911 domain-containing protein [Longimicrobium sp.]|nr:DUF2911 domain-containing protein [Longimicrobium sp.]